MNQIQGIKETCLYIHDLEKAREFYANLIGFPLIDYQPGRHVFFRVGRSVLLCFDPNDSRGKTSPPPHFAEGNQHLAFEVAARDYERTKAALNEKGIQVIDRVTWKSGQESFYFLDPENNVLEIVPVGVWD